MTVARVATNKALLGQCNKRALERLAPDPEPATQSHELATAGAKEFRNHEDTPAVRNELQKSLEVIMLQDSPRKFSLDMKVVQL